MAKKKTQQYQDRKYNYPKGFTKYGKAKTGFMPAAQGARTFVTNNFDKIKSGSIPFDSLTQREKRVYRGKNNPTFENLYKYGDKTYYDPTRSLRKILDNDPNLKGKRDLTNFLKPDDFKNLFDQRLNPTKYADGTNSTLFDFKKGDKKGFYRDESGTLLDIVTKLNKIKRSGRNIRVIDTDGKIYLGSQAIDVMREFESSKLLDTVTYNLNNVQVNDLNNTP